MRVCVCVCTVVCLETRSGGTKSDPHFFMRHLLLQFLFGSSQECYTRDVIATMSSPLLTFTFARHHSVRGPSDLGTQRQTKPDRIRGRAD
uniref:Putative secreted protein n=1 Tax=Anopheles darlingi TaxID=43151 RepID=A0A2M4DKD7_ANODA